VPSVVSYPIPSFHKFFDITKNLRPNKTRELNKLGHVLGNLRISIGQRRVVARKDQVEG